MKDRNIGGHTVMRPPKCTGFGNQVTWPDFRSNHKFPHPVEPEVLEYKLQARGGQQRHHILPIGGWLRNHWEYDFFRLACTYNDWEEARIPGLSEPMYLDTSDNLRLSSIGLRTKHLRSHHCALPFIYNQSDPKLINAEYIIYHGNLPQAFVLAYQTNCPIFLRLLRDLQADELLQADTSLAICLL
jgi:hypothetical protein